jgi:hypothetical protein
MPEATTVDECAARLHTAGWSVGEACFTTVAGSVWQVDGSNGEKRLLARESTQTGAWRAACEQAAAAEPLDR